MKKRAIATVFLTLLIVFSVSMPALANIYRYSDIHFKFIGDIIFERTLNFDLHGGSAFFSIDGKGSSSGAITSKEVEYVKRNPAAEVYRIVALNLQTYINGTTALDAALDEKLLIMSVIKLPEQGVEMSTGVEMNPGETGFISHDIMSSQSSAGNYLKMTNHFGNTGGTTKRILEIHGFLNERMRVDGYAEVWDTTEMSDGKHKSGFWDLLP